MSAKEHPKANKATKPPAKIRSFPRHIMKLYKSGHMLTSAGIAQIRSMYTSGIYQVAELARIFGLTWRNARRWCIMDPTDVALRGAEKPRVCPPRICPKRTPYLLKKVKKVVRSFQKANKAPTKADIVREVGSRLASVKTIHRILDSEFPQAPVQRITASKRAHRTTKPTKARRTPSAV